MNTKLFNQYFITQDEVDSNVKKTLAINEKVLAVSKRLSEQGWETHRNFFVKITDWIGVHENPTAFYEKNKRWVNLPSQELVGYLNRLWELSSKTSASGLILPVVRDEVSDILKKLQDPTIETRIAEQIQMVSNLIHQRKLRASANYVRVSPHIIGKS